MLRQVCGLSLSFVRAGRLGISATLKHTDKTSMKRLQEFGLPCSCSHLQLLTMQVKSPLALWLLSGMPAHICSGVQLQTSWLGLHNHTGAFAFNLFAPEVSVQSGVSLRWCCHTSNHCFSNRGGRSRAEAGVGGSASLATVDGTGPGLPF